MLPHRRATHRGTSLKSDHEGNVILQPGPDRSGFSAGGIPAFKLDMTRAGYFSKLLKTYPCQYDSDEAHVWAVCFRNRFLPPVPPVSGRQ